MTSNKERASSIRWQGRSIEQLGFVNNLIIGLSIAMFAVQFQLFKVSNLSDTVRCLSFVSIVCIFVSEIFGCWTAWNRLNSFRLTAEAARCREDNPREADRTKEEKEEIGDLRKKYKAHDKWTWRLLPTQIILFAVGSALLTTAMLVQLMSI